MSSFTQETNMSSKFYRCFKLGPQGIVISEQATYFAGYMTFSRQVLLTWRLRIVRRPHPSFV
jgi:hypothetical protein